MVVLFIEIDLLFMVLDQKLVVGPEKTRETLIVLFKDSNLSTLVTGLNFHVDTSTYNE